MRNYETIGPRCRFFETFVESWLTLSRVDSAQANTAQRQTPRRLTLSFAGTNFFFAGLSLPINGM